MIEIPSGWPGRTWVEDTPLVHLHTVLSPEASGVWEVASWESTREISSSALPGQIRAKTGLSVGTAKAVVKRAEDDYPWRQRDLFNLTGSDATLQLAPEGRETIPTGQFRVADVNGLVSQLGVDVDLDEKTVEGGDKTANGQGWESSFETMEESVFDPSWWIAGLASQMGYGYGVTPGQEMPDGSTYDPILDVPFQGSIVPAYPYYDIPYEWQGDEPPTYAEIDGVLGVANPVGSLSAAYAVYNLDQPLLRSYTATWDVYGQGRIRFNQSDGPGGIAGSVFVDISNRIDTSSNPSNEIRVRLSSQGVNGTSNTVTSQFFTVPGDSNRPSGVQVQIEFIPTSQNWTSVRARVRRTAGAAWSAWVTHAMANTIGSTDNDYAVWLSPINWANDTPEIISRFSLVDTNSMPAPDLDAILSTVEGPNGRIYLEPLFGTNSSPWLDPDLTVTGAMQAIVDAWQGALITDVYGDLHLLNRFTLSGVGTSQIPIDAGLRFEDIPWVMNYADQADRLVFKYRPARVKGWSEDPSDGFPTLWEAQEVIIVYPGTNSVFFTLDYIYPADLRLIPFARRDNAQARFRHEWDAYRYNNGTPETDAGHIDPNTQIAMRIERVTSSTWRIQIDNLTTQPFHMVTSASQGAQPWLKIRSTYWLDQTQEATVERGLSSVDSRNPLEVDVSNYVQNEEDANALADFIWGRVNRRTWRSKTVNAIPDYRLDLGDVVSLVHTRTGMRSNALVTKVTLAGEPGSLTQQLDLVLIPVTWEDFDEAWAGPTGGTWDDFDALWAPYTWDDFDRAPTATTDEEIRGAM